MQGGIMDGIALTLTSSCHLENGRFQEASWDNYFYTRQWNVPFDVEVHILSPEGIDSPGGGGGPRSAAPPRRWPAPTRGRPVRCRRSSRSAHQAAGLQAQDVHPLRAAVADQRPAVGLLRSPDMPKQTFVLNGRTVTVNVNDDRRVLWVLRDLLGVTGPSTGAASTCARRARATSTARRSTVLGEGRRPQAQGPDHHHRGPRRHAPVTSTRCSRPGSTWTSPSAATASRARSWPPWRSSRRCDGRGATSATPTSTASATSAAAAPTSYPRGDREGRPRHALTSSPTAPTSYGDEGRTVARCGPRRVPARRVGPRAHAGRLGV